MIDNISKFSITWEKDFLKIQGCPLKDEPCIYFRTRKNFIMTANGGIRVV